MFYSEKLEVKNCYVRYGEKKRKNTYNHKNIKINLQFLEAHH